MFAKLFRQTNQEIISHLAKPLSQQSFFRPRLPDRWQRLTRAHLHTARSRGQRLADQGERRRKQNTIVGPQRRDPLSSIDQPVCMEPEPDRGKQERERTSEPENEYIDQTEENGKGPDTTPA